MPAEVREIGGSELMRPHRFDAAIMERPHDISIRPLRPWLQSSLSWREIRDVAQRVFVWVGAFERAGKQLAAEIRPRIRHRMPS
jgi:hypothetical protein